MFPVPEEMLNSPLLLFIISLCLQPVATGFQRSSVSSGSGRVAFPGSSARGSLVSLLSGGNFKQ